MAFKLANSEFFWYVVRVAQVTEDGKTTENHIKLKFKRLDADERRERDLRLGGDIYQQVMIEADDADDIGQKFTRELIKQGKTNKTVEEITSELEEIVCGWDAVADEKGPMDFNHDNLMLMVRYVPNFAGAVNDAYRQAYAGELKRGN